MKSRSREECESMSTCSWQVALLQLGLPGKESEEPGAGWTLVVDTIPPSGEHSLPAHTRVPRHRSRVVGGGLLLPLSSRYKGSRSPHWEAKKPAMEESNDSRGDINVTSPLSLSWYKELTQIHGIHSTLEGKGSQISNLHREHLPSTPNRDQTDRK